MQNNPYKPRTLKWALIEEDWSDLTIEQIAEVFCVSLKYARQAIVTIKKDTGYIVPYRRYVHGETDEN